MTCRGCGFENPQEARFCGMCGKPLGLPCQKCGKENPPGFRYCGSCGASLKADGRFIGKPALSTDHEGPTDCGTERRQMTVMFCDLVGSTTLAERMDPEELRDLIREYQTLCCEAIAVQEGYTARFVGGGILTYFGYPRAHEDDALRAVRAGLGIVRDMRPLSERLERTRGFGLHVRVGIHTGLVVVREMGAAGGRSRTSSGGPRTSRPGSRTSLPRTRSSWGRRLAGYGWFTEGFDSADLREAKQLL